MKKLLTSLIGTLALCSIARGEPVVIVHPSNPLTSLTAAQVAQIFLGSANTFPGGGAAAPAENKGTVRDDFLAKVLGKNSAQVKAIWSRIVFSGKGLPPRELANDAAVKSFVTVTSNGIGYIDRASADASVKIVLP